MTHILLSHGILHHEHIKTRLKDIIRSDHRVAIIFFSMFAHELPDVTSYESVYGVDGSYRIKMIESFAAYNIPKEQISFLHYYQDDLDTLKQKIETADILYFPGGAPDQMMERLKEKNIVDIIRKQKDKIIIGSSAGAMIQFDLYHISKDYDYHRFDIHHGLGLLKAFGIEVHYRRRRTQKAGIKKIHRIMRYPIYAIPDDGMVLIQDKKAIEFVRAWPLYDHRGVVRRK